MTIFCTMASARSHSTPHLHLVLCRLASEDMKWLTQLLSSEIEVFLYNAGSANFHRSELSSEISSQITEIHLGQGEHESYCYLRHIQGFMNDEAFAPVTVFAPASPRCADGPGSSACVLRLVRCVKALASGQASVLLHGVAPIEASPIESFMYGLPRHLVCVKDEYSHLSNGRDLHSDAEFMSFSPWGAFAVERKNLLAAPRGWLRRATYAMGNATAAHAIHQCCLHTCMPWLMERLWLMLLGTSHRGCGSGVRTGFCATEWARGTPTMVDLARGQVATPKEGSGAIKLRLDISRVARVARFTNGLSDDERIVLNDLLLADARKARHGGPSCTTQLCAILELLNKARGGQDADFTQYLDAVSNTSDPMVQMSRTVADRGVRRCRLMLVDSSVLAGSVERVQFAASSPTSAAGTAVLDERQAGPMLHRAIQKVYSACLDQMERDARWYTRPFVYGFARDAKIAIKQPGN